MQLQDREADSAGSGQQCKTNHVMSYLSFSLRLLFSRNGLEKPFAGQKGLRA